MVLNPAYDVFKDSEVRSRLMIMLVTMETAWATCYLLADPSVSL